MNTKLFSSLALRDVVLKNRIVASPMWQYAGQAFKPTDWHLMNLGRLADGGAGLVYQEGTTVERRGCGTLGDIGIWSDDDVEAYSRIVRLIESCGSVPGIQLIHAGRKARQRPPQQGRGALERTSDITDWEAWDVIAPSAIAQAEGFPVPREMTLADIQQVIEAFTAAARRADRAGYRVVQLHAAHGYLLHEFLSPVSNRRTDAYGGSFENRARMLLDVVGGVRSVLPQGKPLVVRLSCIDGQSGGWTLEDTFALVRLLYAHGVDLIDCSSGGIDGSPLTKGLAASYGYQAGLSEAVRRETGVPTTAVGLIVHAHQAESVLQEEKADLVALARELIYNPNWPMDAARKLGDEKSFDVMQRREAFWLERRAITVPDLVPSTFDDPFAPAEVGSSSSAKR
ncbi:NADH:flavin oxidoreductase/NADH oxidase [Rhizobium leguminosarum]|uniref:NADH:flavin oxidoreductase/NADH oxidase n=1 Tax=Rhizobium leguminosarum TaxID=384 RepID=UPI0024A9EA9E|nr:NADH:flavin oxidoreductase/NADH oxidase [Rhizobium leguminosarum]MDI5929680.1 NADH:flavin oxidoreductase/NADH oxidase [Rhizobium leguminosarum]